MIVTNDPQALQLVILITGFFIAGTVLLAYFAFRRWVAKRMQVLLLHPDRRLTRHMVRPDSDGMLKVAKYNARFLFTSESVFHVALPFFGEPIPAIAAHVDKPQAIDIVGLVPKTGVSSVELTSAFDNRMLEQWVRAAKEPGYENMKKLVLVTSGCILLVNLVGFYYIATTILGSSTLLSP